MVEIKSVVAEIKSVMLLIQNWFVVVRPTFLCVLKGVSGLIYSKQQTSLPTTSNHLKVIGKLLGNLSV